MTPIGTPPAPPWAPERFQVKKYNTRYYTDQLAPCTISEPSPDAYPGYSSVKPSKPFTKSIPWGEGKRTVPLDCFRIGEWLPTQVDFDATNPEHIMAMYLAVDQVRERTFARGHAVHHIAECHLNGVRPERWALDCIEALPYFPHILAWIDANIARPIAMEAVIINRAGGYGGTGDLWAELVDGRIAYIDWKSRGDDSAHAIYDEEIGQGGAYNHPDAYMIVPSDDRQAAVRAPLPGATVGIVVSVRPDGAQAYEYEIPGAVATFEQMLVAYRAKSEMGKLARKAKIAAQLPRSETQAPAAGHPTGSVQPPPFDTPTSPGVVSNGGTPAEQRDAVRTDPDEGGPADDVAFDLLQVRYNGLSPKLHTLVTACATEAMQHGVSFHSSGGNRTVRRFEILRGLCLLDEDADGDLLRVMLAEIIGDVAHFPTVAVGHLLGSLTADEAARFARRADEGPFTVTYTPEGVPVLGVAA